ncbi:hypothetical protein M9H77_31833 [Catharanthus roseus]|uniref:Uncharacterized protein n=1 Tax=Catharanthus roseus TaxID=4058 RepID=A0ACC0A525_CATRO|nr:hypothetical protein M9H77_31833 [Catharanthus roseus]
MTLVHRGFPPIPPIPFTIHPPTTSYHPYTPVPYDPYGYSQPPQTSYDPCAHAPSLPIRMPDLDPTQHYSRTQIPLNDVSGLGLQLGAQFFEQLARSVPVDSSYSSAEYGATARGNSLSDVGLGRDSGTSRSEEAVRVGSFCIHSSEGNEDEREDDGGHDDDDNDDSDDDGDDHEPVPVVEASSSGHRPKPDCWVATKKTRPPTNPTQRKKSKNDGWEQTCPADGGPQDPVIIPSYSGHDKGILKSRSRYVSLTVIQSDLDISDSSTGINSQDLAGVADSPRSRLSTEQRTACYVLYLLGSSLFTDKSLDIPIFSHVCTSGESGSEVVQTLHPEVCNVGSQNGEQINRLTHSFRHDDC